MSTEPRQFENDCTAIQERLGALLDGELPDAQRRQIKQHLADCPTCDKEWQALQALAARLQTADPAGRTLLPGDLWSTIETKLADGQRRGHHPFRRLLATAAALALLVGMGTIVAVWLNQTAPTVQAESIDYSILLRDLPQDVDAAFQRFLKYYQAQPIDVSEAAAVAPTLNFGLPAELPSGHRLQQVYRLQFGKTPGIAARYLRDREPIMVFFHTPMRMETHDGNKELPCLIGDRHGSQVEVGNWRLVHVMDPTTCHCVLSRLEVNEGLPAVLMAVAPPLPGAPVAHEHHHP